MKENLTKKQKAFTTVFALTQTQTRLFKFYCKIEAYKIELLLKCSQSD